MIRIIPASLAALTLLSACSGSDEAQDPGRITQDEKAALDDAAAMLDTRAVPTEAPSPAANASPNAEQ